MVKCILISEDSTATEIETPLGSDMYTILKGSSTFVGQWTSENENDDNIIIMQSTNSMLDRNQIILPHPFQNEVIHGPILIVKMNYMAHPQDFTLVEWLELVG